MQDLGAFHDLSFYTLAHPGPDFIHQHIVDAYTAQTADGQTKPIALFFALAGLYLFLEKGYTGKEVQRAHMKMAKGPKEYPLFALPEDRGPMTVHDVLLADEGKKRDDAIRRWCASVWKAFAEQRSAVSKESEKRLQR